MSNPTTDQQTADKIERMRQALKFVRSLMTTFSADPAESVAAAISTIDVALSGGICKWQLDDIGNWQTTCNGTFTLLSRDESPINLGMRFCCFCSMSMVIDRE